MKKENVGIAFLLMAAFLYGSYYITAALYAVGLTGWSKELFQEILSYIGPSLKVVSILCAIVGVIYIARAEWDEYERKHGEEETDKIKSTVKDTIKNVYDKVLSDEEEDKK